MNVAEGCMKWSTPSPCKESQKCVMDICQDIPNVCQAGETFCEGDALKTCNSDGTAIATVEDCSLTGMTCLSQSCAPFPVTCVKVRPIELRTGTPTSASVALFFAVDTCGGEPISELGSDDFKVYEDGQKISPTEAEATVLEPKGKEVFITLLIDKSGSMESSGLIPTAIEAMKAFVTKVFAAPTSTIRLEIAVFNKDVEVWQTFTSDKELLLGRLDDLVNHVPKFKTTNLYGSLMSALASSEAAQVERRTAMKGGVVTLGQVVLFTDGKDEASLATLGEALEAVQDSSDDVLAMAIGSDVNSGGELELDVLKELGSGGLFIVTTAEELKVTFEKAADRVLGLQERTYLLGYCSPKLGGIHDLEVEVMGVGKSMPVSFDATSFGVEGSLCSKLNFEDACNGLECSGLACGGCTPDDRQCSEKGACMCIADSECKDSDQCTQDVCAADGTCSHLSILAECDDKNPCTDDTCEPAAGCKHVKSIGPCPYGTCSGGSCQKELPSGIVASENACVVFNGYPPACWGINDQGQLGIGSVSSYVIDKPAAVNLPAPAMQVSVGQGHGCAVTSTHEVYCWGSNGSGQLGLGSSDSDPHATPAKAMLANAVAVEAGGGVTCALLDTSAVSCWGSNYYGLLGHGTSDDKPHAVPAPIPNLMGIKRIELGNNSHACALGEDQKVRCWGSNLMGELGVVSNYKVGQAVSKPVEIATSTLFVDLSLGASFTCALSVKGEAWCWGWADGGQLGYDAGQSQWKPAPVPGATNAKAIASGGQHTCILALDGSLLCWGSGFAACGVASPDDPYKPIPVSNVAGIANAIKIAAGNSFTCALLSTGAAKCWGDNGYGQLGAGFTDLEPHPEPLDVLMP